MKKYRVLKQIENTGIVAVIRAENSKKAIEITSACINGGISSIEITFTIPKAHKIIEDLDNEFNDTILIGAGTILDSETARIAILSGAKYIVSPSFDLETAKLCNRYQIPYMAGCMTINEIIKAMEAGTDVIKLFPGGIFGPSFIKSIKGPLPQTIIMPTGGVNLDNVTEWIENGCIAVGVGSFLTNGSKKDITEKAKLFIEKIKKTKSKL